MTSARPLRGRERRWLASATCAVIVAAVALSSFASVARAQPALPPVPQVNTGQILTPEVNDPLLTPPPEAPRHIASWDDALALIKAQSPDYITAAQSVVRAEAQKRITLAAVLPVLDAQASFTHQFYTTPISILAPNPMAGGPPVPASFVSPPPNLRTFAGSFDWQVVNPRGIYRVGTESENIKVAKLSFSDQRRQIALSVVHSMLATLAAARVAEVNRVGLRSSLERLALTQARLQYGQGTALDVDRGLRDAESARRLIISGDDALLQAREALGAALGSPLAISPPGGLDLDQFEAAVTRTCHLNDEIDRRPDVAAARGQLEVAERRIHEAELLFSPTLSFSSEFADNNVAVLGPTKTWDVQALVNVPLYDGGARYGALRDARAAAEQARQNLIATRLNAIVGSEQAQRLVGVRQASRDVAKRQVELAQKIDDRTRNGYANGFGNSLDLVTSAEDLRQSEIDLALLDFQVAESRVDAVLTNAECLY
jgi:multidrug efflux system outer membrane protein